MVVNMQECVWNVAVLVTRLIGSQSLGMAGFFLFWVCLLVVVVVCVCGRRDGDGDSKKKSDIWPVVISNIA